MKLLNLNNKTEKKINVVISKPGLGKTRCLIGGLVYPSLLEGKNVLFKTLGEMTDYEVSDLCVKAHMKNSFLNREDAIKDLFYSDKGKLVITDSKEYIDLFEFDLTDQIRYNDSFDIIVIDNANLMENTMNKKHNTEDRLLDIIAKKSLDVNTKYYVTGLTKFNKDDIGKITIAEDNDNERTLAIDGKTIQIKCDFENCIVEEIE